MVPGVGAIVGGGLDLVETKIIADRAYQWFMMGDFADVTENEETVVDIDDSNFECEETEDK